MKKRGEFIGKLHSLRQEFGNKDPIVFMSIYPYTSAAFMGATCGIFMVTMWIGMSWLGCSLTFPESHTKISLIQVYKLHHT